MVGFDLIRLLHGSDGHGKASIENGNAKSQSTAETRRRQKGGRLFNLSSWHSSSPWIPSRRFAHSTFLPAPDQAEIENRCARESFTWGPQALWLLCGLIWLFCLVVRDVPELAWNTMLFGVGASLLAALAVWYEIRRRKRQVVLCPLRGRIGCYRGNRFLYSFSPEEMVRVTTDFFGRLMIVFKLLIPMFLLMVIVAVVMFDGLKQPGVPRLQDLAVFVYAMLFASLRLCRCLALPLQTGFLLDS